MHTINIYIKITNLTVNTFHTGQSETKRNSHVSMVSGGGKEDSAMQNSEKMKLLNHPKSSAFTF